MATTDTFRKLALAFPEATEEPHFEKTSFRVRKKIFATMAEDKKQAMVMLPLIEQSVFCEVDKALIYPVPGHWGTTGCTIFELPKLKQDILNEALTAAYIKVAPKALAASLSGEHEENKTADKHTWFPTPADFRKWLQKNHEKHTELLVGFHKVSSGKPSITWPQSVDEALCFGWIDGIRRNIDKDSYSIRFTPRKANSIWSAVNVKKIAELTEKGLMQPAGLAAYNKLDQSKSKIYSYENMAVPLSEAFQKQFQENEAAWSYFQSMPPSYRKPATNWVMSAKQEVTRVKRLHELIADSAAGRKIKSLSY